MGDSDDFKMLNLQPKNLDFKPNNYPVSEKLPTNCSTLKIENDGSEPKRNANNDEIDIVMSNDGNLPPNKINTDNYFAENDVQEPDNNVKHTIIEVVAKSKDGSISQNSINVDSNHETGEIFKFVFIVFEYFSCLYT